MGNVVCDLLQSASDEDNDFEKPTLEVSDTDVEIINKDSAVLVHTKR